jgi:hypothetical protein
MKRRLNNISAVPIADEEKPSFNADKDDEIVLGGSFAQALRFVFIPHKVNRDEQRIESIRRLCAVGTSFEELILAWVRPQVPSRASLDLADAASASLADSNSGNSADGDTAVDHTVSAARASEIDGRIEQPGYSITISRNDEMPFRSVGVIFERGDRCFGIACVAADQAVSLYGIHERLNESTFSLSDSEGFTCDQEWFEHRNSRLRIVENSERGGHTVPPSSIGELVLEYSLSTAGFVRFAAGERADSGSTEIEITLVFLGKDLTRGWHEEMTVELDALRQYVKGTRSADVPTLLI